MSNQSNANVLLVGSGPFNNAEEMFRMCMEHVGDHIHRLPDGEVGERDTWIRWQHKRIGQSPQLNLTEQGNVYVPFAPYTLVDGVTSPDDISMPNLGYGDAAIESFQVFQKLVDEGTIPADMRFQVGLPTPMAVSNFYVEPGSRELFEPAYARALGEELQKMLQEIPAERLAIQWEVCSEFALLEGLLDNHLDGDLLEQVNTRVGRLIDLVPEPVEVGIHLCYGDSGHKHFCEPEDTTLLVNVANGAAANSNRPIAWIHMPVPKERDDDAFFEPLKDLNLASETELYLGLVHNTGGLEGTQRRYATAKKFVADFGVATECGLGRRPTETIPELLDNHVAVQTT